MSGIETGKKAKVKEMFNRIAGSYDFLNHTLSLGIDKRWRRKALRILSSCSPDSILDVATGTGDLAIEAGKIVGPRKIVGIDIAEEMLVIGKKKISALGLDSKIELIHGDAEHIPFNENSFDAVMVAFGVRNFENLEKGLKEIRRVLKPQGYFMVLEFSMPSGFPVKQLYNFYFSVILPCIGKMISKDKWAYSYLPDSVKQFPEGKEFINLLETNGFKQPEAKRLSFGIATIYYGQKG
jgi:demethylmenaquinone methyltransferase/2-methoxy-6-polyprenyl-1,4-benzoquinol methylase